MAIIDPLTGQVVNTQVGVAAPTLTIGQTAGTYNPKADPFAGLKAGASKEAGGFVGTQINGVTVIRPRDDAATALTRSSALLNNTTAGLAPAESAANIAKIRADAALLTEQAGVVRPLANANIANIGASTRSTDASTAVVNYGQAQLASDDVAKEAQRLANLRRPGGAATPALPAGLTTSALDARVSPYLRR